METKKTIEINIKLLITLCHILDKYEEFHNNLVKLFPYGYKYEVPTKLYKISKGKTVFGAPKLKKFYQENKEVIDAINECTDIELERFIRYNYLSWNKKLEINESLGYFYLYLLRNRGQLDQILSVLEKIASLGFSKIKMAEGYDFTKESQSISPNGYNSKIVYFDNIQIESSYSKDTIKYRTTGSNYRIVCDNLLGNMVKDYSKSIILNSLTFDPSRLPDKISAMSIVDYIVNLSKNLDESYTAIRTSVDLSVNIDDLQEQYETLHKVMEELKNVQIKEKLRKSLVKIQTELAKLHALDTLYKVTITEENPNITLEKLAEERKLYLARRDSTDFD